jgi:hypothetical protein
MPFNFFNMNCVVCSSSICGSWLSLWYRQTLLHSTSCSSVPSIEKSFRDPNYLQSKNTFLCKTISFQHLQYQLLKEGTEEHDVEWRRVWRYQRDNQDPHIEEEQTTQFILLLVLTNSFNLFCHMSRTSYFQWNDGDVRFVLDQHAELDFFTASSLKQQSVGKCVAPLGHIILVWSFSFFIFSVRNESHRWSNG